MGQLEDVCWHEAGHATVAGLHGLRTVYISVFPNDDQTDWCGFRHGITGHPYAQLCVAAGGMAGELISKAASFRAVDATDLSRARNRSDDDRQQYENLRRQKWPNEPPFEDKVAGEVWQNLITLKAQHRALAEELIRRHTVGPLVYAEIMAGLEISQTSRDADDDFIRRLQAKSPPPAVPE